MLTTIIVPAATVEAARELAATVHGGAGMFTTALSPDGSVPVTHYISSGWCSQELADLLPERTDLPPYDAMAAAGLQMVSE